MSVIVIDNDSVMPARSVEDWLTEEINIASKVVMFHSQESICMAYQFVRSTATSSVALDSFLTALEMFSDARVDHHKLVNVYFSYTPPNCVVTINCGESFQLMNEFGKFLASVRGCSVVRPSLLLKCSRGHQLMRAISDAATYMDSNPSNLGFLPPDPDSDSIDTQSMMSRVAAAVSGSMLELDHHDQIYC